MIPSLTSSFLGMKSITSFFPSLCAGIMLGKGESLEVSHTYFASRHVVECFIFNFTSREKKIILQELPWVHTH